MSRPSTLVQLPSAVDGGPFAAEVRALRAAAELSHAEAAQRVGVSLRWWYYLHRGTRPPRPADVLAVAHLDPLTTPAAELTAWRWPRSLESGSRYFPRTLRLGLGWSVTGRVA